MSSPVLRYFEYAHLPEPLLGIAADVARLAKGFDQTLPDGPEKSAGLRKLLEAKDCFVRAALPPAPAYPLVQPPAGTDFVREQMSEEAIASVKLDGETQTLDQGTDVRAPEANPWGLSPQELDKVFPPVEVAAPVKDALGRMVDNKGDLIHQCRADRAVIQGETFSVAGHPGFYCRDHYLEIMATEVPAQPAFQPAGRCECGMFWLHADQDTKLTGNTLHGRRHCGVIAMVKA